MGIFIFWAGQMPLNNFFFFIVPFFWGGGGGGGGVEDLGVGHGHPLSLTPSPKPASEYKEIICLLIYFLSDY
jgi:hypothetical protein